MPISTLLNMSFEFSYSSILYIYLYLFGVTEQVFGGYFMDRVRVTVTNTCICLIK